MLAGQLKSPFLRKVATFSMHTSIPYLSTIAWEIASQGNFDLMLWEDKRYSNLYEAQECPCSHLKATDEPSIITGLFSLTMGLSLC
jgi:hypothetical protein